MGLFHKILGTLSNAFTFGDGTTADKYLYVDNGGANLPGLRRLNSAGVWEFSNDGTNWYAVLGKPGHDALRSLIHFIEDGPAEQFTSGSYCETLPSGNPFPTSCIWYTSIAKTAKIVEETVTWNANKTINTDVWKMYDTDGSTVLVTVTDTYDYTGGNFLTPKRTRTIA